MSKEKIKEFLLEHGEDILGITYSVALVGVGYFVGKTISDDKITQGLLGCESLGIIEVKDPTTGEKIPLMKIGSLTDNMKNGGIV